MFEIYRLNKIKIMKFDEWYEETYGSKSEDTDESHKAFNAWEACKQRVLKILDQKIPKIPGQEGLGGYHWEEMSAEEFRDILREKLKKL
jgi:hypothetical protein